MAKWNASSKPVPSGKLLHLMSVRNSRQSTSSAELVVVDVHQVNWLKTKQS